MPTIVYDAGNRRGKVGPTNEPKNTEVYEYDPGTNKVKKNKK